MWDWHIRFPRSLVESIQILTTIESRYLEMSRFSWTPREAVISILGKQNCTGIAQEPNHTELFPSPPVAHARTESMANGTDRWVVGSLSLLLKCGGGGGKTAITHFNSARVLFHAFHRDLRRLDG